MEYRAWDPGQVDAGQVDAGQVGCRIGEAQDCRYTGNEGCRKLVGFKDAEQEGNMTAWMQDRWDAGLE